jgi:O-acetyl-ADP-ribose deacetylase (regulator of RNase III)
MEVRLFYRQPELGEAWRSVFSHVPNVQIVNGDITACECDAIVSPANSFGFMDGGLDDVLCQRFGRELESRVQAAIHALPMRELLVGQTLVVATDDETTPWLVVAPTMRVPMSFHIATSVNAYLAMKAALLAAREHPAIERLAIPGLCTGVGRMPATIAANQMRIAYNEVMLGGQTPFADFGAAQKHQLELNPQGMIWDF